MTTPLDLDEIRDRWLNLCGACDVGIGECNHPDADHRPVMLALVREVEQLRAEVDAARTDEGQLAFDNPHPGSPTVILDEDDGPEAYWHLTHGGVPAWCCGCCARITLGHTAPALCACGSGEADDFGPLLGDRVREASR